MPDGDRCIHPVGHGVARIQLCDISELAGQGNSVESGIVFVSEGQECEIKAKVGTPAGDHPSPVSGKIAGFPPRVELRDAAGCIPDRLIAGRWQGSKVVRPRAGQWIGKQRTEFVGKQVGILRAWT